MPRSVTRVPWRLALAALVLAAPAFASSHREAPGIATDPVADNTDVYFFRDPVSPSRLVMIANWVPLEEPAGGPNFSHFEPNIRYEFNVDSNGDALEDWVYRVEFTRNVRNGNTFLQNTGPLASPSDPNQNVYYTYTVKKCTGPSPGQTDCTVIGADLLEAPNNVGPKSYPNGYGKGSDIGTTVYDIDDSTRVFAGPRAEGFYVDLGMIFDLINFREGTAVGDHGGGKNDTAGFNVHSIAHLGPDPEPDGQPERPDGYGGPQRHRQHVVLDLAPRYDDALDHGRRSERVGRLGPGLASRQPPDQRSRDSAGHEGRLQRDLPRGRSRELRDLRPQLGARRHHQRALRRPRSAGAAQRPAGSRPGHRRPHHAARRGHLGSAAPERRRPHDADLQLRAGSGVLAGDLAGFPNGRRVYDDTVDIALRVVAGVLVDGYNVAPNNQLGDGVDGPDVPYIAGFPFLGTPHSGYTHVHDQNNARVITRFAQYPHDRRPLTRDLLIPCPRAPVERSAGALFLMVRIGKSLTLARRNIRCADATFSARPASRVSPSASPRRDGR